MLRAQIGGILIDGVIQLMRDFLDALAGLFVYRRTAAQRARYSRLRHPREIGDIDGSGLGGHAINYVPRSITLPVWALAKRIDGLNPCFGRQSPADADERNGSRLYSPFVSNFSAAGQSLSRYSMTKGDH